MMGEISTHTDAVFVIHGYLEHAGPERSGNYCFLISHVPDYRAFVAQTGLRFLHTVIVAV